MFPTRCNFTQVIYFSKTALHVSGGISTHHQLTTVFTASGTCQTVTATFYLIWSVYHFLVTTSSGYRSQSRKLMSPGNQEHAGFLDLLIFVNKQF